MACEVKSLQQAKTESEYKRKKVEAQLQELTSRATEVERAKGELTERSHKLQVNAVPLKILDRNGFDIKALNITLKVKNI